MNEYCTIYVVRHGETTANVRGIMQGTTDYPLTPKGIQQAKNLASEFKHATIDAVFSSDLLRAKRTAEIIALEHELLVTTKKAIRERHFGHFEGKPYEIINEAHKKLLQQFAKLSKEEQFRFKFEPFQESDEELVSRFLLLIREIAVAYAGKTVLMVSHGSIMRSILIHLGFGKNEELPPGAIKNLGYFKIITDGEDVFLKETKNVTKIEK